MDETAPKLHPAIQSLLKYFYAADTTHGLPMCQDFRALAEKIAYFNPTSPETTVALRKLLECRDAALRAAADQKSSEGY